MKSIFAILMSLAALLGAVTHSFAQNASATEVKQANVVATTASSVQANVPAIPPLPRKLKGRWENSPATGNVLEVTVNDVDGTKVRGTLTFWGAKGGYECMQLIDAPMEGTWDGETFQVVAKAHDYTITKCEKAYTLKIGSGKHFLYFEEGSRKRWLDPS